MNQTSKAAVKIALKSREDDLFLIAVEIDETGVYVPYDVSQLASVVELMRIAWS
jgi:hypothetical protein